MGGWRRIDIARWERHLDPSFGTPAPSNEGDAGAPANTPPLSFGTLNAVASHCLRQLAARPPPPSAAAAAADADADAAAAPRRREQLTLVLELALSLLLSQVPPLNHFRIKFFFKTFKFYWVLLGLTRFYWVLLGFTGFY